MGCFGLQVPPNVGGMCGLMGCFDLQVVPLMLGGCVD